MPFCSFGGTQQINASPRNCYVTGIGATGSGSTPTVEDVSELVAVAGVFSKFTVYITTNPTSVSETVRPLFDWVDGNQVVSIGAGLTGRFTDEANTDTITANTKMSVSASRSGGVTYTPNNITMLFTPSSDFANFTHSHTLGATVGSARYFPIRSNGSAFSEASDATVQHKVRIACTWRGLSAGRNSAADVANTYRSRKNGANGTQVVTIGAGLTGRFTDTTHTDSLAIDDLINYSQDSATDVSAGTGLTTTFVTTEDSYDLAYALSTKSSGTSFYYNLSRTTGNTDEAASSNRFLVPKKVTNLRVRIPTNTLGASEIRVRKNEANGNGLLSIGASLTGWFEDTTNEDAFNVTDDFCLHWNSTTGTAATEPYFGITVKEGVAAAVARSQVMMMG